MILEEDKAFARAMLGDDVVDEAERNAVLVHEGVRGMKWGIWNEETRKRRMRERGLRKARKARAKKAKLAKIEAKKAEKERAEIERLSDTKAYKRAQKEFKKKVYDIYRNLDKMSLEDISKVKKQIDDGAALLDVRLKPAQKKTATEKLKSATSFLSTIAADLGKVGENVPKIIKGYNALFGDMDLDDLESIAKEAKGDKKKK